ncbi:MAG TPA: hypothetical protein PL126_05080, partial [Candidatus Cloacimonadota bacterium]|nr:hypothetical protein [Candidatus Cloacimonadota bacterium]
EYCHNTALTANSLSSTAFAPGKWQNPESALFENNPAPLSGQVCPQIKAILFPARHSHPQCHGQNGFPYTNKKLGEATKPTTPNKP